MKWQPIETAPLAWEPVLMWAVTQQEYDDAEDESRFAEPTIVIAAHSDIQPGVWWMHGTMERVYHPTKWMPLPDAPQ